MKAKNHITKSATVRCYGPLNDFLPAGRRQRTFAYPFFGTPSIKDALEAIGIPHTEIELLLVNGSPTGWDYLVQPGDRIAAYPLLTRLPVPDAPPLRPPFTGELTFVLDVHLGKLARYLRILGYDAVYKNHLDDPEIITISLRDQRQVLTRDQGLLKHKRLLYGYWVRATQPLKQIQELIRRFGISPTSHCLQRCLECNVLLKRVAREKVTHTLPPSMKNSHRTVFKCPACQRVYWRGSHHIAMESWIMGLFPEFLATPT